MKQMAECGGSQCGWLIIFSAGTYLELSKEKAEGKGAVQRLPFCQRVKETPAVWTRDGKAAAAAQVLAAPAMTARLPRTDTRTPGVTV